MLLHETSRDFIDLFDQRAYNQSLCIEMQSIYIFTAATCFCTISKRERMWNPRLFQHF